GRGVRCDHRELVVQLGRRVLFRSDLVKKTPKGSVHFTGIFACRDPACWARKATVSQTWSSSLPRPHSAPVSSPHSWDGLVAVPSSTPGTSRTRDAALNLLVRRRAPDDSGILDTAVASTVPVAEPRECDRDRLHFRPSFRLFLPLFATRLLAVGI